MMNKYHTGFQSGQALLHVPIIGTHRTGTDEDLLPYRINLSTLPDKRQRTFVAHRISGRTETGQWQLQILGYARLILAV